MNATHTPGPWHFESTHEPDGETTAIAVRTSHLFIAAVEPHHDSVADAIANARLIAAAPELLDGCNALLGLLQLINDRLPESLRSDLVGNHRIEEARAAVAKAAA